MRKIFLLLIIFALRFSYSQIDDIPIDNSEVWGSYNKEAVTSSIKNSYQPALWLSSFDKYITERKEIKSLSEVEKGFYRISLKSFCVRPGKPNGGEGYGCLLAPLKGEKSKAIKYIIKRWGSHKDIEQKYVQTLIWGLIAGIDYSDYPNDFKKKVDPLLPDNEKKGGLGIKLSDLMDLPLPEEVKQQLRIFEDMRSIIKEGINRYEDLERIAVPQVGVQPSKNDKNIDYGTWTLMDGGYYVRAFIVGYLTTTMEIYKPEQTEISFDAKQRIISMNSANGRIEVDYDESEEANAITFGSNSYKINRIKNIKLDGIELSDYKDALWYSPYNFKTLSSSGFKRIFDPNEKTFNERDKQVKEYIDVLKKYCEKKKVKLKESDVETIYNLKQFEMCVKFILDMSSVIGEDKEKLGRIVIDATTSKVNEVVPTNKLSSGGLRKESFGFDMLVAVPGSDGAQRIGITPEGEGERENPTILLHNVYCDVLPAPGELYSVNLEILNNTKQIDEIVFDLYDISTEKGRYLNDKEQINNLEPDLFFEPSLCPGYEIIQASSAANWFIARGNGSSPLQVIVKCRDYGAFAKLKARVTIEGRTYNATADVFGSHINIPCDNDNDHIADKWEQDNNVSGLPPDWDEENNPAGQRTTGDGMTLYEEYRGFFELLPDGTPQHVRLDPNMKEIFAIDDDFMLSTYSWEHASGIPVYRVNEAFVYGTLCGGDMSVNPRYRLLNFCSGYSSGVKYAVNVVKINGLDDPYDLCGTDTTYDGCSHIGPPINANVTIILPDRSRRFLEGIRNTLQNVYNGDTSSLVYYVEGEFLEHHTMLSCLHALTDPAEFSLLLEFYVKTCAVHEVGHACGIQHHSPETGGDQDCPMRYYEYFDPLRLFARYYRDVISLLNEGITPMVALGTLHFCRTGDNCWNQITVNDRRP